MLHGHSWSLQKGFADEDGTATNFIMTKKRNLRTYRWGFLMSEPRWWREKIDFTTSFQSPRNFTSELLLWRWKQSLSINMRAKGLRTPTSRRWRLIFPGPQDGHEKDRFTVMLGCTADGGKLPPYVVFKRKTLSGATRPRRPCRPLSRATRTSQWYPMARHRSCSYLRQFGLFTRLGLFLEESSKINDFRRK